MYKRQGQRLCILSRTGWLRDYNRSLEQHLSKVVDENQTDWDQRIPLFLMAYKSSVHDTTGMAPAKLVFGREIRLPGDLMLATQKIPGVSCLFFADDVLIWATGSNILALEEALNKALAKLEVSEACLLYTSRCV